MPSHNVGKKAEHSLLIALACGATVEMAAQKVGISRRTAERRLADPEFRRRLAAMRADMTERTVAMLTAAGMESTKTLMALQDASMPPAVRLGAARAVLDLGAKLREGPGGVLIQNVQQVTESVMPADYATRARAMLILEESGVLTLSPGTRAALTMVADPTKEDLRSGDDDDDHREDSGDDPDDVVGEDGPEPTNGSKPKPEMVIVSEKPRPVPRISAFRRTDD